MQPSEELKIFLLKCFLEKQNRRQILKHWHALTPKTVVIRDHLADFINVLLYRPATLVVYKTHMQVFVGENTWSIYRKWLVTTTTTNHIWQIMETYAKEIFQHCKYCQNDEYVFSLPNFSMEDIFTRECRRQLVRDFCWMIREKNNHSLWIHFIISVQTVLNTPPGSKDVWLNTLHHACQGQCNLDEVPCWDLTPLDVHSSVAMMNNNK